MRGILIVLFWLIASLQTLAVTVSDFPECAVRPFALRACPLGHGNDGF